ncbi:hypothetical protein DMN91_001698 [Ooceraea biroi]|uniref:Uncharacterized protein n=1 Tax=Ooceraea biroi TaxID=2015173 RepID=A0A3L8DZ19_OOCBI|nr:hypothetical protein DMN91_001698 [Ooceraea biroi]
MIIMCLPKRIEDIDLRGQSVHVGAPADVFENLPLNIHAHWIVSGLITLKMDTEAIRDSPTEVVENSGIDQAVQSTPKINDILQSRTTNYYYEFGPVHRSFNDRETAHGDTLKGLAHFSFELRTIMYDPVHRSFSNRETIHGVTLKRLHDVFF